MCAGRTAGFARLYDLTERVLPATLDTTDPGRLAATRHLLLRGLGGLGVATALEMADYFRLKPADETKTALDGLIDPAKIASNNKRILRKIQFGGALRWRDLNR